MIFFKKGQKVILVDITRDYDLTKDPSQNFQNGQMFTVKNDVDNEFNVLVHLEGDGGPGYYQEAFRLATPEDEAYAEFPEKLSKVLE